MDKFVKGFIVMSIVYLGAAAGEAARGGSRARTPAEWALYAGGLAATAVAAWLVGRTAKRALAAKVPSKRKEN